jgi:hypothetical protein
MASIIAVIGIATAPATARERKRYGQPAAPCPETGADRMEQEQDPEHETNEHGQARPAGGGQITKLLPCRKPYGETDQDHDRNRGPHPSESRILAEQEQGCGAHD